MRRPRGRAYVDCCYNTHCERTRRRRAECRLRAAPARRVPREPRGRPARVARALRERRPRPRRRPARASRGCWRPAGGGGRRQRRRGRSAAARRPAPQPHRADGAASTRRCSAASPRRWRSSRRTACTATSRRGSTRSAPSRPATRRSTRSGSSPPLTPELQARIPAPLLRLYVAGRDARRRAAAAAGDVLRDDRVRDRAHLRPRAARLAAPGDRVGRYRRPLTADEKRRLLDAPHRGRGLRAVPAPLVPRPEAVLDRGARRDDPDARRGDRARRRRRARTRS